jgi:hypothetical protein
LVIEASGMTTPTPLMMTRCMLLNDPRAVAATLPTHALQFRGLPVDTFAV